jgi:hypothetical protein
MGNVLHHVQDLIQNLLRHSRQKKIKTTPLRKPPPSLGTCCMLGVAMSRPEPPLLPEEEDDQKNGNENDEAGLEDWKKRVLHAACC